MKLMFYLDTKHIWLQSQFEYFDLNPSLMNRKPKFQKLKIIFLLKSPPIQSCALFKRTTVNKVVKYLGLS